MSSSRISGRRTDLEKFGDDERGFYRSYAASRYKQHMIVIYNALRFGNKLANHFRELIVGASECKFELELKSRRGTCRKLAQKERRNYSIPDSNQIRR